MISDQEKKNHRVAIPSYTLAEEWDSALVIFNDGANQYPAAMEPGVELSEGMSYSVPG